jgi:hypothetical protein
MGQLIVDRRLGTTDHPRHLVAAVTLDRGQLFKVVELLER